MSHSETIALSSMVLTVRKRQHQAQLQKVKPGGRKGSLVPVRGKWGRESEWGWGSGEGKRATHGPMVWFTEITFFCSALPGARPPWALSVRQRVPASPAPHICLLVLLPPPPPQAYKQNKPNDQTNREFPTAWVEGSECEVLFIPCLGARSLERNMHGAIPYHAGREAFERCRSAHIPPSFN